MNLNYVGSVAERFMKFRSSLASTEEISENLFNAISIYVPKSLAEDNLASGSYDPDEITATKYAVIPVTADNYSDVLADSLLNQWTPVFNNGANFSVTLYIIIFDDTSFTPTISATSISWSPLTKAFKELYFISFFKTMFSDSYNGSDTNFFDLSLCLSQLCATEDTLSECLIELKVVVPAGDTDDNTCKILSHTRGEEELHCTTLAGSTLVDREEYFWGYVKLLGGGHTWIILNNGKFMFPIVLGKWFEATNSSGQFIGNKLQKIRLNADGVKPTGNPSPLNSAVNMNMDSKWYTNLDDKYVGYFISIADNSLNDAELVRDRNVTGMPVTAYMISKWIDYTASQTLAKYRDDVSTLTEPVLANEETYSYIQNLVQQTINTFAGTGRITDVILSFPSYADAKKGNSFEGVAVWSARYVNDLDGVNISGSISF